MASSNYSSGSPGRRRHRNPRPVGQLRSAPIPKFEVRQPPRPEPATSKCIPVRLYLVWAVLLAGILGLCANLFRLQIARGPFLKEQAEYQQQQRSMPFIPRRPITDRNGNILAIDRQVYTLYAHPVLFKDPPEEVARQLASVLVFDDLSSPSAEDLLDLFGLAQSGIKVADALAEEVGDRILDLRLDGLELIRRPHRLYPQEGLGADVVGYVDDEGNGQAGVEHSQENLLRRTMPSLLFQRAVNGAWVPAKLATGFVQMDDLELRLTIDSRLQRLARKALAEQVQAYKAERGTAIVMDARDGSILTLVNEPSYNPNEYFKFDPELFKNWALTDLYEPGSTFKPINVALALEAGAIAPDTFINDEGSIQMGPWTISNADFSSAGARGMVSITDIIKYSSNIGMVRIMQRMDPQVYYEGLQRLGLGKPLDIDLPFVATGTLKSSEQFVNVPIEVATSSFGQGFSITPLQLAQINASLANGGKLVTPHVVEGLFNSEGQLYWQMSRPEPQQVFSPQTTQTVVEMMETVVEGGTGKNAHIPGYRIGGKTGTAEKASASGGYYRGTYITSFVGIIPVDAPRYVVVAVVDEPEGGSGGLVAAPVVKSIMEGLITLEHIPPSQK
ncbi:penicillin-binding protein 2 [Lyngbya sp. CCY1209]|uniref:peptidoglycan D,D-transpeptidase FtsI family protein n=1 Tax=Lyngbya sp. CCY1209 TaxID=2886103 RepID=UPI002D1FE660|nr:penicillin-binding protein 2 [Lyngbya sp. CCY1209]MEB3886568.1 penicillin-binding protein 2 [Lyngbya sp. CCY1209]